MQQNEIETRLADLDEWGSDGKSISKRFEFGNSVESLKFVTAVSNIAEEMNHHPDVQFGWGYAVISFTTHSAGGLTEKDFAAAARVDGISEIVL